MEKRRLGRTELDVSVLGLGCFQLTNEFKVTRPEASAIFAEAARGGVNLLDTAATYALGESEELVGRALQDNPTWAPAIASKCGHLDRSIVQRAGDDAYQDAELLTRTIKHSMWRLRRDFVEVFMVHEPDWPQWGFDYETGDSVIINVLEDLKSQGVIGGIGVGGWKNDIATNLVESGRVDVVLAAGGVNLVDRPMFETLIPAAQRHDVGVIVGGAFGQNSRFLITRSPEDVRRLYDEGDASRAVLAQKLEALYELSDECAIELPELAVRYLLSLEEIHSHVGGAQRVEHLKANLDSISKGPLSADILDRINTIQELGTSAPAQRVRVEFVGDHSIAEAPQRNG